jgi:hypothetical protein
MLCAAGHRIVKTTMRHGRRALIRFSKRSVIRGARGETTPL